MTVDLTNCDREPIHIPGAVQPHGALIACRSDDLTIVHVSDSVREHLGVEPLAMLGTPLRQWLSPASWAAFERAAAAGLPREANPHHVILESGKEFDGIAHVSTTPGISILELEPLRGALTGFHPRTRASVRRLQDAHTRQEMCATAAREVRNLTGFDRVMIYRFDRDWNGEVVAEERRDDLEPFLGLHYPASDIPAQARRLYTLNWLRLIPDIGYRPSPLVPDTAPGQDPLDLSFSVLRSVSPIHVEYLRNMGVTASMSISLIRDGQLVGLIACHHYSGPHYMPFLIRESAEFIGQALSWHLSSLDAREATEHDLHIHRAESAIVSTIATARSIPLGLCVPALLDLTGAAGAALLYDRDVHTIGTVPSVGQIREIVQAVRPGQHEWLASTDKLTDVWPQGAALYDVAAGVLIVEISRELQEYVVWFRPATDRQVDWAGDPRKSAAPSGANDPPRLSPRGSFALWREIVQGRSLPWEPWQLEGARNLRRLMVGSLRQRAEELRQVNERLSHADRMKDEFLATVGHELRTPLNAIFGWLQILRTAGVPPDQRDRAIEVIERNARAQGQLINDLLDVSRIVQGKLTIEVQPVSLHEVIAAALEAMGPPAAAKEIRLQSALDSAALVLGDEQRLRQVLANLLSNAIKFTPRGGRVMVALERLNSSALVTVTDSGEGIPESFLPHVFDRFRQEDSSVARRTSGLGLGLAIVRHLVELHGGTVTAHSEGKGKGATFTVRLPLAAATRHAAAIADATPQATELTCPPELVGLRILVVENDDDAREMLRALLERCRSIVEVAADAKSGLDLVTAFKPNVIVSDIGMPAIDGFAFIEQLRARPPQDGGAVPAIALTAHARVEDRARALHAGFDNHVPKPIEPIELFAVIAALAANRSRRPLQ